MTEISDINTYVAQKPRATLAEMQGAAAWQALLGITEFTLYYQVSDRSVEDYKAYCDYVGRPNAVLREAIPDNRVLLYYPIDDLQEEYIPRNERLNINNQSKRAQTIVRSFDHLGRYLLKHQKPFFTADAALIQNAETISGNGKAALTIGNQKVASVVLPRGVRLPDEVTEKLTDYVRHGGRVFNASDCLTEEETAKTNLFFKDDGTESLDPPSGNIQFGRFQRSGRTIMMLFNSGNTPYSGSLRLPEGTSQSDLFNACDPATGEIKQCRVDAGRRLNVELDPARTILFVSE